MYRGRCRGTGRCVEVDVGYMVVYRGSCRGRGRCIEVDVGVQGGV